MRRNASVNEEKLKIAVFIDFDNIQIGVRSTLSRDFDLGLVLEALKERGEVVTKVAYGNWKRAGDLTRTLTQNAVLMVQRDLTPRGDKNGADINLALDALETAIHHPHINAFVIVGGDSDFIALVEKLKTYNKAVFVVGGRSFTSSVLQRNCREFIAYENLIESQGSDRRREEGVRRREVYPLGRALPLVDRALKVLSDREVQAQLGLLKSTLIQLDSTFNERDYGSSSFRQFVQKLADAQAVSLRQQGNSYVVEPVEREVEREPLTLEAAEPISDSTDEGPLDGEAAEVIEMPVAATPEPPVLFVAEPSHPQEEAVELLQKVLLPLRGTNPRPLYLRNVKQLLRTELPNFDEQNYGFASLVDLLRAGQNLNLLRLQRDRRGALRVFIPGPPPAVSSASAGEAGARIAGPAMEGEFTAESAESDALLEVVLAENAPAAGEPSEAGGLVASLKKSDDDSEDSQIALLGYYDGVPGGEVTEELKLSLAAAVVEEATPPRKKRAPRKTSTAKAEGVKPVTPRRRKPAAGKGSTSKPSSRKS